MAGLSSLLNDLCTQHGELTPGIVVSAATPPESPLHSRFEWDDSRAGHQYRLSQARQLIRSVKVTYVERDGEESRVREFVSVTNGEGERAYRPTREVVTDDMMAATMLRDFRVQLAALRRSYEHLSEFRDIVRAEMLGEAG